MKNFFKFLGIISLVLVIGFSMAACKDDDGGDDNGGDNGGQTGGGNSGLTITNIPSDITGYIKGMAGQPSIYLAVDYAASTANQKPAPITGGKVTLNAFVATTQGLGTKYTGTTSMSYLSINVYSTETEAWSGTTPKYELKSGKTIQFTNGSATLNWDDIEKK